MHFVALHLLRLLFHTHAVLNEDFEYFETVLTIPAGTTLNQPVCVYELQFGIVDNQIVEDPQSFNVVPSSVSPANTLTVSNSFIVTIQDNDCEFITKKLLLIKPSHSPIIACSRL